MSAMISAHMWRLRFGWRANVKDTSRLDNAINEELLLGNELRTRRLGHANE